MPYFSRNAIKSLLLCQKTTKWPNFWFPSGIGLQLIDNEIHKTCRGKKKQQYQARDNIPASKTACAVANYECSK